MPSIKERFQEVGMSLNKVLAVLAILVAVFGVVVHLEYSILLAIVLLGLAILV